MSRNRPSKKSGRSRTDKEKLELFVKKADELLQTKLSLSGCRISHNIRYSIGQPIQSTLEQPTESDFKEHLMAFRHFISEAEDVYLNHILNIFYVACTDEEGKQCIAELRKSFNKVKEDDSIQLYVNKEKYTPLRATDMFLNGKYFHNDLEYQEFLSNLDPLTADVFRAHFLNFVINVSKIVIVVRNNIEYALSQNVLNFGS